MSGSIPDRGNQYSISSIADEVCNAITLDLWIRLTKANWEAGGMANNRLEMVFTPEGHHVNYKSTNAEIDGSKISLT